MFLRLRPRPRLLRPAPLIRSRYFFQFFRNKLPKNDNPRDNLFHPFSKSPSPAIRARGEAVQSLAPCPVCATSHDLFHVHANTQPPLVQFECPDCGWPTHCSEEHWKEDEEHQKYCKRLKEANEDEHDLRSGRHLPEFDLPGACPPCPESNQMPQLAQDRRDLKKPFHLQTGMSFGTPVVLRPWTLNVQEGTRANSLHILSLSAEPFTSIAV